MHYVCILCLDYISMLYVSSEPYKEMGYYTILVDFVG